MLRARVLTIVALCPLAYLAYHASATTADELYGIRSSSTQAEISRIDPYTGAVTPLFSTPAASLVYGGMNAADPVTRQLFFASSTSVIHTASVTSSTASSSTLSASGFYLLASKPGMYLVGLGSIGGNVWSVRIDAGSGLVTPLFSTGASAFTGGGVHAYDSNGDRFFFIVTPQLYQTNTATGANSSVNLSTPGLFLLAYNAQYNSLLGVGNVAGQVQLVRIDPQTGIVSPLFPTGASTYVYGGFHAFDSSTQTFIFQSSSSTINTVNAVNGVTTSAPLSTPSLYLLSSLPPLATMQGSGAEIPILTPPLLALFGLLLVAVGLWALRASG